MNSQELNKFIDLIGENANLKIEEINGFYDVISDKFKDASEEEKTLIYFIIMTALSQIEDVSKGNFNPNHKIVLDMLKNVDLKKRGKND